MTGRGPISGGAQNALCGAPLTSRAVRSWARHRQVGIYARSCSASGNRHSERAVCILHLRARPFSAMSTRTVYQLRCSQHGTTGEEDNARATSARGPVGGGLCIFVCGYGGPRSRVASPPKELTGGLRELSTICLDVRFTKSVGCMIDRGRSSIQGLSMRPYTPHSSQLLSVRSNAPSGPPPPLAVSSRRHR